jgi:hypothetical protein
MHPSSSSTYGNTIAEYLLIGGLCVLVAIPGLGAVAQAFGGVFATAQAIASGQYNVANAARPPQQQQLAQAPGSPATGQTESPAAPATNPALSEAELMNPLDNAQLVEVGGGAGATNTLAERIKQLAELKQSQGKISEEQAQSLIDLANQGHQIGKVMALINETGTAGQVQYNGKLYNREDLAYLLDSWNVDPRNPSEFDRLLNPDPKEQGEEILKFSTLYQQAVSMGAIGQGEVASFVQQLASNIAINSEAVAHRVIEDKAPEGPVKIEQYIPTTHQNSGGICSAGNGTDSGSQCQ